MQLPATYHPPYSLNLAPSDYCSLIISGIINAEDSFLVTQNYSQLSTNGSVDMTKNDTELDFSSLQGKWKSTVNYRDHVEKQTNAYYSSSSFSPCRPVDLTHSYVRPRNF